MVGRDFGVGKDQQDRNPVTDDDDSLGNDYASHTVFLMRAGLRSLQHGGRWFE
jgi:hypothetical protein